MQSLEPRQQSPFSCKSAEAPNQGLAGACRLPPPSQLVGGGQDPNREPGASCSQRPEEDKDPPRQHLSQGQGQVSFTSYALVLCPVCQGLEAWPGCDCSWLGGQYQAVHGAGLWGASGAEAAPWGLVQARGFSMGSSKELCKVPGAAGVCLTQPGVPRTPPAHASHLPHALVSAQIPRYILTLHELLAHTPHEHVERNSLDYAKSKLEELSRSEQLTCGSRVSSSEKRKGSGVLQRWAALALLTAGEHGEPARRGGTVRARCGASPGKLRSVRAGDVQSSTGPWPSRRWLQLHAGCIAAGRLTVALPGDRCCQAPSVLECRLC